MADGRCRGTPGGAIGPLARDADLMRDGPMDELARQTPRMPHAEIARIDIELIDAHILHTHDILYT